MLSICPEERVCDVDDAVSSEDKRFALIGRRVGGRLSMGAVSIPCAVEVRVDEGSKDLGAARRCDTLASLVKDITVVCGQPCSGQE